MTGPPARIQLSRAKGFRLQEVSRALNGRGAVKVDRTTKWGNPFKVAPMPVCGGNREWRRREERRRRWASVAKFTALMETNPRDDLHELRGENLACWCPLPAPGEQDLCHAAVLLKLANR